MSLKQFIREQAQEIRISDVGFTDVSPFERTSSELYSRKEKGTFNISPKKIRRMCNPDRVVQSAGSVIVCTLNYRDENTLLPVPDDMGFIAPYTRKNNYEALKQKMITLTKRISEQERGCSFYTQSCYGRLSEKEACVRAGLGWYGKNGTIISPVFGSWFVIGLIVTDIVIEPDSPLNRQCPEDCFKCIQTCPTGALSEYCVNVNNCLQSISEREFEITSEIRKVWKNRFYGCSDCLFACPFNQETPLAEHHNIGKVPHPVDLSWFLDLSDEEFAKVFGSNQIGMRNISILRRNTELALLDAKEFNES